MEYELQEMVDFFKGAGDINRIKIIHLLASNTIDKLCVIDISKILGVTQPAASQHIKVLKNIGIVIPNKVGNKVYYTINVEELLKFQNKINIMFENAFIECENNKC